MQQTTTFKSSVSNFFFLIFALIHPKYKVITKRRMREKFEENCAFTNRIIDGHYALIPSEQKIHSKEAFRVWYEKHVQLFEKASQQILERRNTFLEHEQWHIFKPSYLMEKPQEGKAVLFLQDVFTVPFPSTHDMDDWARSTMIGDVFILHGITERDSPRYHIHEKHHYVNHEMVRGIIQVDIYKLENV